MLLCCYVTMLLFRLSSIHHDPGRPNLPMPKFCAYDGPLSLLFLLFSHNPLLLQVAFDTQKLSDSK